MIMDKNPLRQLQEAAGAKFGKWFGVELPSEFAGFDAEYRAARETIAVIDKNYRAWFSFTGPDRVRYLNAILTSNIRDLAEGQSAPSLFLNAQGHILAEMDICALPGRLIAVSYAMVRETLGAQFDKYIIMDDVTLEDQTDNTGALALEGPATPIAVRELCGVDFNSLAESAFTETTIIAGITDAPPNTVGAKAFPCRVHRRTVGGVPSAEFTVARAGLPALWSALTACAARHGGQPVGYNALSALRLEADIPWFGYDFDETTLPHEAGLENSHINYSKGCYLGQEIVERVRSRGRVNRHLALVEFSGETIPPRGATLLAGAASAEAAAAAVAPAAIKAAGQVTRAAWSPARNQPLGMACLRREFLAPGTKLRWEHGEGVLLHEVPLDVPHEIPGEVASGQLGNGQREMAATPPDARGLGKS
jgi:folate-binding protein YgfZ